MWWKDLDICLIGKNPQIKNYEYRRDLLQEGVDIEFLEYITLNELFDGDKQNIGASNDIIKKGVMIYEKS